MIRLMKLASGETIIADVQEDTNVASTKKTPERRFFFVTKPMTVNQIGNAFVLKKWVNGALAKVYPIPTDHILMYMEEDSGDIDPVLLETYQDA